MEEERPTDRPTEPNRTERVRGVGCDATVPKCAVKREVCSVAKRSVSTPRTYEVNSSGVGVGVFKQCRGECGNINQRDN